MADDGEEFPGLVEQFPFLKSVPNYAQIEAFSHAGGFGFSIAFGETGFGFGEITFYVDRETGEASFDPEAMSMERCAKYVMQTIGSTVLDAREVHERAMAEREEMRKQRESTTPEEAGA